MTAVVAPPTTAVPFTLSTIPVTGHGNNTVYVATVTFASGRVKNIQFTTDGSGAANPTFVPQWDDKGAYTITVRPLAETVGTTAATSTNSGKVT